MSIVSILDGVNSPKDIKKLNIDQLNQLCTEIRELMINTVADNGGHLASNLGTVELTVAIHKVFNSPRDQIVFDVGHQSYTHKIPTGRKDRFSTLRQEGGISGFTRPAESKHDIFSSGHSSTSISAAIGLAKAKSITGEKGKVVAVIGDGALTGGLAYEALNNSGLENNNLVVILNDNNMSISPNVGSMAKNLTNTRTNPKYFTFRSKVERRVSRMPKFGTEIARTITLINSKIRKSVYKNTFFEDLGFRYYGPIDGHNLEELIDALNVAKAHNHSVLIHVNTIKGKRMPQSDKFIFRQVKLFQHLAEAILDSSRIRQPVCFSICNKLFQRICTGFQCLKLLHHTIRNRYTSFLGLSRRLNQHQLRFLLAVSARESLDYMSHMDSSGRKVNILKPQATDFSQLHAHF